jgi:hypothetical protein
MEAELAEADVILRHSHLKPSLRLLSMHQNFGIRTYSTPSCIERAPMSFGIAEQNGKEEPTGDTIGVQCRAPRRHGETNSIHLSRRLYVALTGVRRSPAIGG